MIRALLAIVPIVAGAYYFTSGPSYSRIVDRTPQQVAVGLADLDITDQPGAPGSTAVGNILPVFKRETTADGIAWKVMSGNNVAVTMTAHLTPIDGGKRTQVTASVERGNAPDDFVSPAFRSTGLTMGLFAMALEDELNDLTRAMAGDPRACKELQARFEMSNMEAAGPNEERSLTSAMGDVAKISMKLQAYDAEARRLGCRNVGFQKPGSSSAMDDSSFSLDPKEVKRMDDGSEWGGAAR
jgi:hypothetical protein